MRIVGERVKCANCGMIYERPPVQKVFWIGVPFTVGGTEFCPKCGSNAADLIERPQIYITTDTTNGDNQDKKPCSCGREGSLDHEDFCESGRPWL